jgi:chemotaxis protein MotB
LGFFAVLLSMSEINPIKVEMFSKYFSKESSKLSMTQLQELVQQFIKNENLQDQVNAKLTMRGVEINFKDKLLFPVGSADVSSAGKDALQKMGEMLNYQEIMTRKISVEGHTDSVRIKSLVFPTNWELSSARAATVVRFFTNQGLGPERFESIGYADTKPVKIEPDKTKGVPENRRVVVVIKPESFSEDADREEITVTGGTTDKTFTKAPVHPVAPQTVPADAQPSATTAPIASTPVTEPVAATPTPAAKPEVQKQVPAEKPKIPVKQQMELHYTMALAYMQQGRKQLAYDEFQKILAINPTHQPSLLRLEKLKKDLKIK